MANFKAFRGTITLISDFITGTNDEYSGCYKLMTVQNEEGSIVNFVISPATYFVNHAMVSMGDSVTGWYDIDVPVPMIYPPQYRAVVMALNSPYYNVKLDYFNSQLISSDSMLKLNLAPNTLIVLENDQAFNKSPANRNLIVIYGPSTKSIPAQTTPYKIVVLCYGVER